MLRESIQMSIEPKFQRSQRDYLKSLDTDSRRDTMNPLMAKTDRFLFPAKGLPAQLLERIQCGETGYWQHQFDRLADREQPFYWNLGIANGQIVYSGNRVWSSQMLLRVVGRYIAQTRTHSVRLQFEQLKRRVREESLNSVQLLMMMKQSSIITEPQLREALRIKILNDLDIYLLMGSGTAKFIAEDIEHQLPVEGFSPIVLLDEANQRHLQWTELRQQVPSMKLYPILDRQAMDNARLSDRQRQRIEKLVQPDKSLNEIAERMAKDNLEVAQMFAKLARIGLVKFKPRPEHTTATVMAIDDSPVLLSQFERWVSALGYQVVTCQEAKNALDTILAIKPSIIFIDINMPEVSGFELVKQIRLQPALRQIPLAILTGEQKHSNKWRAQWSGCEFLTKPLTSAAICEFQVQLEELIPRLIANPVSQIEIQPI
jgi:CheY-like chemotaxis protein